MSAPLSGKVKSCRGVITEHNITSDGGNHHFCRWTITNFASDIEQTEWNSPKFTVPYRDGCKWYLSFQNIHSEMNDPFIFCSVRLVLDRTSDCKAAVAKFKLYYSSNQQDIQFWKTFKFTTKSENSAGFLFSIDKKKFCDFNSHTGKLYLDIVCKIMIESVFLEDDMFSTNFGSLLKTQPFTDFVISVGTKNYPVHKAILTARSSIFTDIIAHNGTENQGIMYIEDLGEDVVEEMLHYIYTGQLKKLEDLAPYLLKAADKYDLKGLRIKCEEILIEFLSSSNAFDLLLIAETCNSIELKFKAINFIIKSTYLVKTSTWERFSDSNPKLIREICEAILHSKFQSEENGLTTD